MALVLKQNFVIEDINDEKGNKIGQIKFNPNDSRIMAKLSKIVKDLSGYIKKLENFGDFPEISKEKLETLEDFEKISDSFEKINQAFEIEEKAVDSTINDLKEIFGEETIDIFTGGTKDIYTLMPLIEFILPYVKNARESKMSKYMPNKANNDVLD